MLLVKVRFLSRSLTGTVSQFSGGNTTSDERKHGAHNGRRAVPVSIVILPWRAVTTVYPAAGSFPWVDIKFPLLSAVSWEKYAI